MERSIDTQIELIDTMGSYFAGSELVTREELRVFCEGALKRHPEIQALEWAPRVPHTRREAFEAAARRDGLTSYAFAERTEDGQAVSAAQREDYLPVHYVEPLAGNGAAIGHDLGSNAVRLAAFGNARDTGAMTATTRITLVQETAGQYAYLLFQPVFELSTARRSRAWPTGAGLWPASGSVCSVSACWSRVC